MMKNVCKSYKAWLISTMVSLNPIMIDGTGMCGGCRVQIGGETKFACVDGRDFDGFLVDFDECIAERQGMFKEEEHECKMMALEEKHNGEEKYESDRDSNAGTGTRCKK